MTSFTNGNPAWYSYDCSVTPNSFTLASPTEGSKFQYFSFIQSGTCYANIIGYNVEPLALMENATSITERLDSKARHVTSPALSTSYNVNCNLFYFKDLEAHATSISETPIKIGSFQCGVSSNSTQQSNTISFPSANVTNIQGRITNGTDTIFIMAIPNYTAGFVSAMGSNSFGIEKYLDRLTITGDGFDCTVIFESNMCGWLENPWPAVKKMLGEDWVGDWFYVFIWFPFPMVVYLATRNGTYAGFLGLGIMLAIQQIDPVIFQVALSMVAICAGFVFYESVRKRLMND